MMPRPASSSSMLWSATRWRCWPPSPRPRRPASWWFQGAAADAVGLLALVAGQDVELVPDPQNPDGAGTWRVAQRVAPDRVISTVDPESRHAHKTTSRRQDGFKAHVVVEPDTGIITACAVSRASGEGSADAAAGTALLVTDVTVPVDEPVEVLGDSAYGTRTCSPRWQPLGTSRWSSLGRSTRPCPAGSPLRTFTVNIDAGTMICPAGVTRAINRVRQVNFGVACRSCPLRARCTRSATGKSMRIREHDALQRAHRARAADPDFLALYRRHRPMVERSLAWITRGNRRLRYRGTAKNTAWLHLRVGAINLRRLLALGLQRRDAGWALAG
jgi:Transposase DDE domain